MKEYTQKQEAELSKLHREYRRLTKAAERNPEDKEMYLEMRKKVIRQKEKIRNQK